MMLSWCKFMFLVVALNYYSATAQECLEEATKVGNDAGCGCDALSNAREKLHQLKPNLEGLPVSAKLKEIQQADDQLLGTNVETPMVEIPGGEFLMGTDNPFIPMDGEMPARRVKLPPYKLQQFEVSNRQFAEFVMATSFQTEAELFGWSFCLDKSVSPEISAKITQVVEEVPWWLPVEGSNWFHPNGPDMDIVSDGKLQYPVVHVSYNDAKQYCQWLGLRLPTEAEFERAARGTGEATWLYPWGNELTPDGVHRANLWQGEFPKVNSKEDGFEYSAPVDSFGPQNEYGVYNIIGNVWEWVADAWNVRHSKDQVLENPLFEIKGRIDDPEVERTKRGGSYMCHESYCYRYRVAARSHNTADSSAQNLGFRCASSL